MNQFYFQSWIVVNVFPYIYIPTDSILIALPTGIDWLQFQSEIVILLEKKF
jgi:hypothetical protein